MNTANIFCPVRLLAYLPIFRDIHYRNRVRRYGKMREVYCKKSHQLLTFEEVGEYIGMEAQQLISFLPDHEQKKIV